MLSPRLLKQLAEQHGTPLFAVDHREIRRNYATFKKHLPRVQAYYAVKANPDPGIVRTLFKAGASFDVASMPEFMIVHEHIQSMPAKKRQNWIWDKIIYANPVKDTGSVVELSSKFGASPGEAVDLIEAAFNAGLVVEGLSFHVGSQCTNFQNYVQALGIADSIFKEAWDRGYDKVKILDIGGGFPAAYDQHVRPFAELARTLNAEFERLFPPEMEILAEPGRFLVATAATLVVEIIGKAVRNGKQCYTINDGVYGTYSGVLFDHCQYHFKAFKIGPTQISSVFGPTCDALDVVSVAEELPVNLDLGDRLMSENIGAYTTASATNFNGMPRPKVVAVAT